ncbi:VOC family protein [Chitinophaga sp. Hz27]|uniref:VOC family protein n=1 Tax=Chitinophaga sp. Hz27 TaxID=3347169 RepID=UPI0035E2AF54
MAIINAYLTFDGNCRDAMMFYKECFQGELILQTVKGSPMESEWPAEYHYKILHASLQNENLTLLATDMVESSGLINGNNISLSLICKTEEEIKYLFEKLAEGGTVKYPLHTFYGGILGGITDKFCINWMLKL